MEIDNGLISSGINLVHHGINSSSNNFSNNRVHNQLPQALRDLKLTSAITEEDLVLDSEPSPVQSKYRNRRQNGLEITKFSTDNNSSNNRSGSSSGGSGNIKNSKVSKDNNALVIDLVLHEYDNVEQPSYSNEVLA